MYGSNFCSPTVSPRETSRRPIEAAAIPLPSEDTTPPVMKMKPVSFGTWAGRSEYLALMKACPRSLVAAAPESAL